MRTKRYSDEDLSAAITAICNRTLTTVQACRTFNIPRSTILMKLPLMSNPKSYSFLSAQEESNLAHFFVDKCKNGNYITKADIVAKLDEILLPSGRQNPFSAGRRMYGWLRCFFRRHPEVPKKNFVGEEFRQKRRAHYKCYTDTNLRQAIDAVLNKTMSIRKASEVFRIPGSTLEAKLPVISGISRNATSLSKDEEAALARLVIERHDSGSPLTRMQIRFEAQKLIEASGRTSSARNTCPTYRWLAKFLRRNPQVREEFIKKS